MGKDEQRSLGGAHTHLDPGHLGQFLAPDAAGIDHDGSVELLVCTGIAVVCANSFDGIAFAEDAGHFRLQAHLASVQFGVQHIGGAQAEGVYAAVRHAHSANDVRVYGRLQAAGQVGVYDIGPDSGVAAGLDEGFLVVEVVFREGDKEAVGLVYAVGGYPSENHIFADALLGRFRVAYGITGAGMQEAVVAAGGAGGYVGAVYQQGTQASHGAVSLGTGTGDASAYDNDVKFV